MPLYVADYLSATTHLNAAESGAYLHLLMHYWQKGSLPKEDRFLARIARMTDRQWSASKPVLQEFFTADWVNSRLEMERAKALSKAEARAECGSRGGNAKALKTKEALLAKANDPPKQEHQQKPSEPLPSSQGLDTTSVVSEKIAQARLAFSRFWKAWPNKVGRPVAERAFSRHADEIDAIMTGVAAYVRDKPPDRPWLNPATFLNQRRWEDAPASTGPLRIPPPSARPPPRDAPLSPRMQALMEAASDDDEPTDQSEDDGAASGDSDPPRDHAAGGSGCVDGWVVGAR
jgi:uncharacterized protein YdaU (DUF1376 family)